jgi:hypothetical protein
MDVEESGRELTDHASTAATKAARMAYSVMVAPASLARRSWELSARAMVLAPALYSEIDIFKS